jgi:hypothetical protein
MYIGKYSSKHEVRDHLLIVESMNEINQWNT